MGALGLGSPIPQAPTSEPYSLVLQSDQPIKEKKDLQGKF